MTLIHDNMAKVEYRYSSSKYYQTLGISLAVTALVFFFDGNALLPKALISLGVFAILFFLLVFRKTLLSATILGDTVVLEVGYPFLHTKKHALPMASLDVVYLEEVVKQGMKRRVFTIHRGRRRLIKMVPDAQGWSAEMLQELSNDLQC